jgi:hypothetical protein
MAVPTEVVPSGLAPVEYAVIEFRPGQVTFPASIAVELARLTEAGLIGVLDLLVVQKAHDGSVEGFEVDDLAIDQLCGLEEQVAEVLAEGDVSTLAEVMEPGTVAGVIVWEHRWAASLAGLARASGGRVLAVGSIPARDLLDGLGERRTSEVE